MNNIDEEPTSVIKLTRAQVHDALVGMVEQLQSDYQDEQDQWDNAYILCTYFESTMIRTHIVPHIRNCDELDWLHANNIRYTIKSSVDQLVSLNMLRLQIPKREMRSAFHKWRQEA